MVRMFLSGLALMLLVAASTSARTRESLEDGAWEQIAWYPAGTPGAGDTVVILNEVSDPPPYLFGPLIIRGGGRLVVEGATPTFAGLVNRGSLTIPGTSLLRVAGAVVNDGVIEGEGTLQVSGDGSTISGSQPLTHLLVGGVAGTTVRLAGPVTLRTLWLAEENRLDVADYNLTVNGSYASNSLYGRPGIVGSAGLISLNGSVYGTVAGNVRLGSAPGARLSRRAGPPSVYGVLGAPGSAVALAASRTLTSCVLMGDVEVDSGVVAEAAGVGPDGRVRVFGRLVNRGTLRAADERYRWTVDSVLLNTGVIEACTVEMTGYRPLLTNSGRWEGSTSLLYSGSAGGRLDVNGVGVVSKLAIVPQGSGDSDVVVQINGSPLRIRHEYSGDAASGCRLVSDTVVSVWGRAHGVIEANVRFEGFWGSAIGGRFGRDSGCVRVLYPKRIDRSFAARDSLVTDPTGRLTVAASAVVEGRGVIGGPLVFEEGGAMRVEGDLELRRAVTGSGRLAIVDSVAQLDVRDTIGSGVGLEIGDSVVAAQVTLVRTLRAPGLLIHAGSGLDYRGEDSIAVSGDFLYDLLLPSGYSMVSAAASPFHSAVDSLFPGRASSLYRFAGEYVVVDTVRAGEGYYVEYPAETTIRHRGRFINTPLTIPVVAGWNLIGGASLPIRAEDVTVTGTTLIGGFSTQQGAPGTALLLPGRSYWVQAVGAGSITLHARPAE